MSETSRNRPSKASWSSSVSAACKRLMHSEAAKTRGSCDVPSSLCQTLDAALMVDTPQDLHCY